MSRFVLRKLDVTTGCFLEQVLFSTEDIAGLVKLIDTDSLKTGMRFRLDRDEFCLVADSYSVGIGRDAAHGELLCVSDKFRLDPQSHTGRELLLMLEGTNHLRHL